MLLTEDFAQPREVLLRRCAAAARQLEAGHRDGFGRRWEFAEDEADFAGVDVISLELVPDRFMEVRAVWAGGRRVLDQSGARVRRAEHHVVRTGTIVGGYTAVAAAAGGQRQQACAAQDQLPTADNAHARIPPEIAWRHRVFLALRKPQP